MKKAWYTSRIDTTRMYRDREHRGHGGVKKNSSNLSCEIFSLYDKKMGMGMGGHPGHWTPL
jgi:hypothetical protein